MNRERHPDREKWNRKYREKVVPDFSSSALFFALEEKVSPTNLLDGDVLELACGASGTALALAHQGRRVMAVDISDVGIDLLIEESKRQNLADKIEPVKADLIGWFPPRKGFSLVICSFYWDRRVFEHACRWVMPGGYLAWEAFSLEEQKYRSRFPAIYCTKENEPESLLPESFTIIECRTIDDGRSASKRLIARRRTIQG
uniref:Methyltransferase domain-containing protein n=1 Tax=Candidatus Kentrum sp. MB TaxID=2138164 RepID=A0A450XX69_9GAMM|nr:MAG: Methyltransferase domain-containing protein [Candidatus Kentron sp. MB]VFK33837.1 MAG: Methyltransferase domain-containing protein [Candidatus Kentron sp. MB]VFK76429.1 MAG: Methyltransferase domain-containing protein [Candidatus Kentron sp. MB]